MACESKERGIGYRGYIDWVRWHIILTPESIDIYMIDPAVIDGKKMQLPGEILTLANQRRKSAEVIVLGGNELPPKGEWQRTHNQGRAEH